ncbi:MAG: NAD(P)/FAD-dependent oxidoreductase [Candidatus Diapherotrites archaeon]|nr:NAD(P)/FAD-dependent oxidoreductase [Candidatus Diapherotrites archaeon]
MVFGDFLIAVIGGGVCGAISAGTCAKKGFDVSLFEEHPVVGEPVQCTGLVSNKGLLRIGVEPKKFSVNQVKGARIFSPAGDVLEISGKRPKASVIDRSALDRHFAEKAEKAGCIMFVGEKATGFSANNTTSVLKTTCGKFEVERIVGADGVFSKTASWLNLPKTPAPVFAKQFVLEGIEKDRNFVELYFGQKVAPGFFAWVVPEKEFVRVGLGVRDPGTLNAFAGRFLDRFPEGEVVSVQSGAIPQGIRKKTAGSNGLVVGDAAGQVKASSGGGVVFGGLCASFAHLSPQEYEVQWRKQFEADLRNHFFIRKCLNRVSDKSFDALLRKAKEQGVDETVSVFGEMEETKALAKQMFFRHKSFLVRAALSYVFG